MSIYAIMDEQLIGQIATSHGWAQFTEWVEGMENVPDLLHLVTWGWDEDLPNVASQLRRGLRNSKPSPEVQDIATTLIDLIEAREETGVLTITDGLGPG